MDFEDGSADSIRIDVFFGTGSMPRIQQGKDCPSLKIDNPMGQYCNNLIIE
jgi:hypothetical protein